MPQIFNKHLIQVGRFPLAAVKRLFVSSAACFGLHLPATNLPRNAINTFSFASTGGGG